MNPVALIIALPILKGLFEGGSVAVSPTVTTSSPPPAAKQTLVTSVLGPTNNQQYQDAILRQSQFTQPTITTPAQVKDVVTGVVVPIRKISDTAKQIRDRLQYGSGL